MKHIKELFKTRKFEIIATISIVLLLVVLLFDCIVCNVEDYKEYYSGYEAIFGYKIEVIDNHTIDIIKFNIIGLISILLLIAGTVTLYFNKKVTNIISIICFVAGSIILFFLDKSLVLESPTTKYQYSLALGGYILVVLGLIASYCSIYLYILKHKKEQKKTTDKN